MNQSTELQVPRVAQFSKGQRVRYVPHHAHQDASHPDCEDGVVSSTNAAFVFVKYDRPGLPMLTGDEPYTAQATEPGQLLHL